MSELWLRKLAGGLLMPLPLVTIVLAIGLALVVWPRTRRAGRAVATVGFAALLCLAYGFPFERIARDLERQYPALTRPEMVPDVRWIVVLGGGASADTTLPPSSRLMPDSLYRVIEAVRLQRAIPGSRIILCGGAVLGPTADASVARELARALGVADDALVVEERPRDTREEALYVRQRTGDERLIVVTSAIHMPRAMLVFEAAGLHPVAAPTQYRVGRGGGGLHPDNFLPSVERLAVAHAAAHELLGTWWFRLRDTGDRRDQMR